MMRPRSFLTAIASGLLGAFLLWGTAAAQVPGSGVTTKPPFVNGDCVKASGPGSISTTGSTCGGTGTVTSVNASGGTTGLTFSGGPITTSGTLTLAGGLVVANGGTGAATFTTNGILYGNGTSALGVTAACTTGQVLAGNTGVAPSCQALTGLGVTSLSFGTTGLTPSTGTQGAITVAGTLGFANGGTSNTSYTDGQLLIGNTATGGLSKATLTQGANITITNGNGTITIASSGGGGTGCTTSGTITSVLTDDGAGGCTSNPAFQYSAGTATLGTAGSVVGKVALKNATSGTLTLSPPTGALGTVAVTVPAATDTLVNLASVQALTNKTIDSSVIGGVTPAAATVTTLTATGQTSLGGAAGAEAIRAVVVASAVNRAEFQGAATTGNPQLTWTGSDANVAGVYVTKGTGDHFFYTNSSTLQARIIHTASANRYLTFTGGVSGSSTNPTIGSSGGEVDVSSNNGRLGILNASAPVLNFNATGLGSDLKIWDVLHNGALTIRAVNDAYGAATSAYAIGRGTTYNVASHTWYTSAVAGTAVQQMQLTSSGLALTTALSPGNGGTGQTTYTDGQLLIGNTSGNTLTKATLTQGTGITITNGGGSITIAATGGSLAAISVQTANFNAAVNSVYCPDTTSGAVTATLPASPANNDQIRFVSCSDFSVNALVIGRNGNTIAGVAEDMTVNNINAAFTMIFVTSYGWRMF